jgi:hypothetical protein
VRRDDTEALVAGTSRSELLAPPAGVSSPLATASLRQGGRSGGQSGRRRRPGAELPTARPPSELVQPRDCVRVEGVVRSSLGCATSVGGAAPDSWPTPNRPLVDRLRYRRVGSATFESKPEPETDENCAGQAVDPMLPGPVDERAPGA